MPDLSQILAARSDALLAGLDEARAILEHAGTKGAARESAIAEMLRDYVPDQFAVETGFAASADGRMSRQQDVLVTRASNLRRLARYGGASVQPIENVVASIEVKSIVTSSNNVTDALDQLASLKQLAPEVPGQQKLAAGLATGPVCSPFTGLVVYDNPLSVETTGQAIRDWHKDRPAKERLNAYWAIGEFCLAWGVEQADGSTATAYDPNNSSAFPDNYEFKHVNYADAKPSLARFLAVLLAFIQNYLHPPLDLLQYLAAADTD